MWLFVCFIAPFLLCNWLECLLIFTIIILLLKIAWHQTDIHLGKQENLHYDQPQLRVRQAKGNMLKKKKSVSLTYCAWHHALAWHQVVIKALQATVQGVGDSALVVVQVGVHGLRSQRATWCLLNDKDGEIRVVFCSVFSSKQLT